MNAYEAAALRAIQSCCPFTPAQIMVHGTGVSNHRNTEAAAARTVVTMGRRTPIGRIPGRITRSWTVGTTLHVSVA